MNSAILRVCSAGVVVLWALESLAAEPSVKIGTAPLLTPAQANDYYPATTTSTFGLGAYDTNADPVPAEIEQLARSLQGDVDLIYDFVRNNVRTEWMYGTKKGAVGALIELSGTSFDQAALMVALLRQSGYTASYVAGTRTFTGAEWEKWAGITSAAATCQLLSSGGFGAVVNNDSTKATCAWGSTAVTSVVLSHIWVKVNIGGVSYVFDPSYKAHTFVAGRTNLATDLGLTPGAPLSAATGGIERDAAGAAANIAYARKLNDAALTQTLQDYGDSLLSVITQNHFAADLSDVVGGHTIDRVDDATRVTAIAGAAAQREWTGGIPDAYRTTFKIVIKKALPTGEGVVPVNAVITVGSGTRPPLFTDEIAGGVLSFRVNSKKTAFTGTLTVRGASLGSYSAPYANTSQFQQTPEYSYGEVVLDVNHPYAANSGAYMDITGLTKQATFATHLTVVHAWGDTSQRSIEKWGQGSDSPYIAGFTESYDGQCDSCTSNFYMPTHGDSRREKLAINWLAQASTAARLHADLARSLYAHHHSIGLAYGDVSVKKSNLYPIGQDPYYIWNIVDNFDRIDVDSAFSLTSKTANVTERRAAVHAIAATSAALEGSVAAQISDTPETASTSVRFRWGNRPVDEANGGVGSERRFYLFNSANGSTLSTSPDENLLLLENQTANASSDHQWKTDCIVGGSHLNNLRGRLGLAIENYAKVNYEIVTVGEAYLGPGTRCGPWNDSQPTLNSQAWPRFDSLQRGGAFVATRYDAMGDPTEIAHVVVSASSDSKGGGSGAQTNHDTSYDPSQAADLLKARFVDSSNAMGVDLKKGQVTYESPVSLTVGNGGFPYELSASLSFRSGFPDFGMSAPPTYSEPQTPWTSNWQNKLSISGSGLEAMGAGDIRATAGTIAAFAALQDTYKQARSVEREAAAALIAAWWTDQLVGNVVTVMVGTDTKQFVRTVDDQWVAPGAGSHATLTQTGSRTKEYEPPCHATGTIDVILTRTWDSSGMSFKVTNANGDEQTFQYWMEDFLTDSNHGCARQRGFRLTNWTWPTGMSVSVNYSVPDDYSLPLISSVTNNIGRRIDFINGGLGGFTNGLTGSDQRQITVTANADGSTTHTNQEEKAYRFVPEGQGAGWRVLKEVYSPSNPSTPILSYLYESLLPRRVLEIRDAVALQEGNRSSYQFFIAEGVRGERINPAGNRYVAMYDLPRRPDSAEPGQPSPAPQSTVRTNRHINELGHKTEIAFDGRGRITEYLYPEFDRELFEYDVRNNPTKLTKVSKPTDTLANIVIEANWNATWNKPNWVKDALQRQTDFQYYSSGSGKSLLEKATRPAPDPSQPTTRPIYSFTYNGLGQLLQSTDPTGLVVLNAYETGGYRNRTSTAVNPAGLNLTTAFTYDAQGDIKTTTDPVGNASSQLYDNARRKTDTLHHDGPATANVLAAERIVYDEEGRVKNELAGKTFSGTAVSTWETVATKTYTPTGKLKLVTDGDSRTTAYTYDVLDRVDVVTDPQLRKTKAIYNAIGQVLQEIRGYESGREIRYATFTYSPNGNKTSVADARNNLTSYTYDGLDRPKRTCFPGSANCNAATPSGLYEEIVIYDAQGNIRDRRNRANEHLLYTYDGLDRLKTKDASGVVATWTYDLAGRVQSIADTAGYSVSNGYDAAKRLTSTGRLIPGLSGWRSTSYHLNQNGNRVRRYWSGTNKFYIIYQYDKLNRLWLVRSATVSGPPLNQMTTYSELAAYGYDHRSRRTSLTYGNGLVVGTPTYSVAGDLQSLSHDFALTANDVTFNYGYTAAHQLQSLTSSNAAYLCLTGTPCAPSSTNAYAVNDLNQYSSINGQALTYDNKGNLTADGVWTFGYDAENRLVSASKSGTSVTYGYDPLGRRAKKMVNGVSSYYLGDHEDEEVSEYDSSGALTVRFVPGPAVDQPIAQISALGAVTYFHKNKLGSVVAMSDAAGQLVEGPYKYDAYGRGAQATGTPYKFTGRRLDSETGLYYYRARYYSADLGRFLQADPIGYNDDLNLYAYVRNNPPNATDPTGMVGEFQAFQLVAAGVGVDAATPDPTDAVAPAKAAVYTAALVSTAVGGVINVIVNAISESGSDAGATPEAKPSDRPPGPDGKTGSTGGPGSGKRFPAESPGTKAGKEGAPCRYCGKTTTNESGRPNSRERDHIDPKSRGGNNSPENEGDSCRDCNRSKGAQNPDEWRPDK